MSTARSPSPERPATIIPAARRSTAARSTWRKPAARSPFPGNVTISTARPLGATGQHVSHPQREQPNRLDGRDELLRRLCRPQSLFRIARQQSDVGRHQRHDRRGRDRTRRSGDQHYRNSTLTVNTTSADCSFNGYFRNGNYGSGSTGTLALVKSGSYKLTLVGRTSAAIPAERPSPAARCNSATARPTPSCPATSPTTPRWPLTSPAARALTYSGAISGTGSVTSLGAGTLTFSGTTANSYSGGTTVSNGRLVLAKSAGVLAIPGNVTINSPPAPTVTSSSTPRARFRRRPS